VVSTSARTTIRTRFAAVGVTIVGATKKLLGAVRAIVAGIAVTGPAERVLVLIRGTVGQLTIAATVGGFRAYFAAVSASIVATATTLYSLAATRFSSAGIATSTTAWRVVRLIRHTVGVIITAGAAVTSPVIVVIMTRIVYLANKTLSIPVTNKLSNIPLVRKVIDALKQVGQNT
jgi:hypothetical protein